MTSLAVVIKTKHEDDIIEEKQMVYKKRQDKMETLKLLNKLDNSKLQFYNGSLNLKCCDNASMLNVDILRH